ncbi:MAG: hypothetical protein J0H08_18235, partial [Rhizobiales bacterium]|nr:hypothetical protein [Hyphomicrobiales bacterium]
MASFKHAAVLASCLLASAVAAGTAHAHSAHQRPRIGASHLTPSGAPEDWGTYCVTELAPLFREALALNEMTLASADPAAAAPPSAPPAGGDLSAVGTSPVKPYAPPVADLTPTIPLLPPIPPSLMDAPEQKTDQITD